MAQRVLLVELLGDVTSVGPRGFVGTVFRRRVGWLVGGGAVAVRCKEPGRLLAVVPEVSLVVGGKCSEGYV
jgi:hypothetical protein